jgi:hypothetical protein
MSDDPELEAFLKQFRPRRPAPLQSPPSSGVRPWRFVAVAAGLLALVLVFILEPRPGARPPRSGESTSGVPLPTVAVLGAALRAGRYEAVLDQTNARLLPNPLRPGSALSELGDINRDR